MLYNLTLGLDKIFPNVPRMQLLHSITPTEAAKLNPKDFSYSLGVMSGL